MDRDSLIAKTWSRISPIGNIFSWILEMKQKNKALLQKRQMTKGCFKGGTWPSPILNIYQLPLALDRYQSKNN